MPDIYSWILSPEIQEYLRENYRPTMLEQQALVRSAYRPIEEKMSAFQELCGKAEAADERAFLEKSIKVYQLAIQEIHRCRRGEFYLYRTGLQFGGDSSLFAFPFSYIGDNHAGIFRSYEQMILELGGDDPFYCPVSCGYIVEKWRCKGEWRPVLRFDLRPMDGAYRTTNFYLDASMTEQTGFNDRAWKNNCEPDSGNPCPFPFSTGDLVYMDAPLLEQPVYGVLCRWTSIHPAYNVEKFILLGYIENSRFRTMDLSGSDIAFAGSGYRVIDWIHSVSAEELPAKQEILGEIGAYLRYLNRQNWAAAKKQFIHIFVRSQNKPNYVPYHVQQATLSELIGKT